MLPFKYIIVFAACVFNFQLCCALKSNLAFVIDATISMSEDIDAVKTEVNKIFDAFANSLESDIEDFIITVFRDPDVELPLITKDKDEFKNKIYSIEVIQNYDCPEVSISAIISTLKVSKPGSFLFVFTDADAKDKHLYDVAKSLAIDKGSTIYFLLTRGCTLENPEDGLVYDNLADETNGIKFNMNKMELPQMIELVKETIKGRKSVIARQKFPGGINHMDFEVDRNMKELVILLAGDSSKIGVTDPLGNEAVIEETVTLSRAALVKVKEVMPGIYKCRLESEGPIVVSVIATDTMHFDIGFSNHAPGSIDETSTQPLPVENVYLSVKLTRTDAKINLRSVEIQSLDHKMLKELSLDLINMKDKFFATTDPFKLPDSSFRVAVKGYDHVLEKEIIRIGLVPIEKQDPKKVTTTNEAPKTVTIGETNLRIDFQEVTQLKCKISGYPKPIVKWYDDDGNALRSTEIQLKLAGDFLSVMKVDSKDVTFKPHKHETVNTYKCVANNVLGSDSAEVAITFIETKYIDVLETPQGGNIKLGDDKSFTCKINASPLAKVKWYKSLKSTGGRFSQIKNGQLKYYKISDDNTVLTIKSMQPHLDGLYACQAVNNFNKKNFKFNVKTVGVEKPVINKSSNVARVERNAEAVIQCKITKGKPKPKIRWFFQQKYTKKTMVLNETGEVVVMRKTDLKNAGTYRCEAYNIAGEDFHYIDLIVEFAPKILERKKRALRAHVEGSIELPCYAVGEPTPNVTWLRNNEEIKLPNDHFHLLKLKNSLTFKAKLNDGGKYTCRAENKLGVSVSEDVTVKVIVPVTISAPTTRFYNVAVGDYVALDCLADGNPKPNIRWVFRSFDKAIDETLPASKYLKNGTLPLKIIQRHRGGQYTCIASNTDTYATVTYEVKVLYAPVIIHQSSTTSYAAVVGDIVTRIPCITKGNPEPKITWSKDGLHLALGSDPYFLDNDGSLLIHEINSEQEGLYLCESKNSLGIARRVYILVVNESPPVGFPGKTTYVKRRENAVIDCIVPHSLVDSVKWFKGGKLVERGELKLKNFSDRDAGDYTCHVSSYSGTKTGYIKVLVGSAPKFTKRGPNTLDIEYIEDQKATLNCKVHGNPTPKVSWWHNKKYMNTSEMLLKYTMKPELKGIYYCLAENKFGNVVRIFEITTKGCRINIEKSINSKYPAVFTDSFNSVPYHEHVNGNFIIPLYRSVLLACPHDFQLFPYDHVKAYCEGESKFQIDGKVYKYSELNCVDNLEPTVFQTGNQCNNENTETINIGYELKNEFQKVYEVCFDSYKQRPVYVKYDMQPNFANSNLKNHKFFETALLQYDMNMTYDCFIQFDWISWLLKRSYVKDDKCCFSKRQLLNAKDMPLGLEQVMSYVNLNVVPHWSTCNAKNWDNIEERVRRLVKSYNRTLTVWTGTTESLKMKNIISKDTVITLINKENKLYVPKYLWKVVQDPVKRASLAIIQLNVPEMSGYTPVAMIFAETSPG